MQNRQSQYEAQIASPEPQPLMRSASIFANARFGGIEGVSALGRAIEGLTLVLSLIVTALFFRVVQKHRRLHGDQVGIETEPSKPPSTADALWESWADH